MASPMGKINVDDNDNQPLTVVSTYGSEGKHREAQSTLVQTPTRYESVGCLWPLRAANVVCDGSAEH